MESAEPQADGAQATSIALRSGQPMPLVGFGIWKIPKDTTAETVYTAIKNGYRLIDSACDYGNEKQAGEGIKRAIDEGIVKREDLFITSKLWNTYHKQEHVEPACKKSLEDLGLEYLDLYLIHFPISLKFVPFDVRYPPEWTYDPTEETPVMVEEPVSYRETWMAMEELQKSGLCKNIGVSNINACMIRDLMSYATVLPSVLQVEIHPYNSQNTLVRYAHSKGLQVTGFSSLGAPSYFELGMATQQESCMEEESVKAIAEAKGKTPAQIILRWSVQRNIAIIPKSVNPERQVQNMSLFDFTLSDDEMKTMNALDKGKRFNDPGHFCELAFNTFFPIYE